MKYVLTGGHGSGKTSILLYLERLNEYIIREAASDYFYIERAKRELFPLDNKYCEDEILSIHLKREKSIPENISRVFLDRGTIDHLVYSKLYDLPLSEKNIYESKEVKYNLAFFIDLPSDFGIGLCTYRENLESLNIHKELLKAYLDCGIKVHRIKPAPLLKRVQKILRIVKDFEKETL
ncbi:MAG: ATP-binding protein [Melioribacteraceae bacterium]